MTTNTAVFPVPLKLALIGDAVASGATGLLLAAGAGLLFPLLGLDEAFMRAAGLFLIPFALVVAFIGTRRTVSRPLAWVIVAVNILWVVESLMVAFGPGHAPTGLGLAFVLAQAVVVGAFAAVQALALAKPAR